MLENIKRWINGDMGISGEYQYKAIHLITTGVVIAVIVVLAILASSKKLSKKQKKAILVTVSVFQLSFEVLWRLLFFFVRKMDIKQWWPMYPCNLAGILIPIIALCNFKTGKKMFYLFGFVGGVLTFALPEGIFVRDVITFPILKSVIQHTGILMIPVIEYFSGDYKTSIGDYGWMFSALLIHLVNCEVVDRWLGFDGDYMFLNSGLPFVIPGVPQWLTMSVFALLFLALLSYISDIKKSNEQFRALNSYFKKSKNNNENTAQN